MQLAFDFKLKSEANFANFVIGANAIVVDLLKKFSQGQGDNYYYLWSHPGDGLSHLLQAVCHQAEQSSVENIYVPVTELKVFGPDFLQTLDDSPLVCIDDIHLFAGEKIWEEALFHAFNRIQERGHRLLLGAHRPVAECKFQLPDLVSRLAWGAAYFLAPLDDDNKMLLLQQAAKRRGFHLPQEVAHYLLAHYPRDMQTLLTILDKLDYVSLQEKRKITVPFVKAKLESI